MARRRKAQQADDEDTERIYQLCVELARTCEGYTTDEIFIALTELLTTTVAMAHDLKSLPEFLDMFTQEVQHKWLEQHHPKGRPL